MEPFSESNRGWVVVAGSFLANAVGFGLLYSFGVFFPSILDEFKQGRGGTAWIFSIAAGVLLGSGGLVGRVVDRFGPKWVVAGGAVLLSAGLLLSSFAVAIWQVLLSYGLLLGLGVSCAFLPAVSAVGQWFVRRRGLATGIAVAGSGVGTVIMAPVSNQLITAFDWRGASRILAVGGFVLLMIAAMLVRGRSVGHRTGMLKAMSKNRTFRVLYASAFFASYGYWVPFVHILPYARDHGMTEATGAVLIAAMGAANTVGRVLLGAVADKFGRLRIFQFAMAAMAGSTLLWPLAQGRAGLTLFAVVYGFFAGAFISLLPALAGDYFGVERLAGTIGLINTGAALGTLLGSPVSGSLFDAFGSYTTAIILAGASVVVGTAFIMMLPNPARKTVPQPEFI